MALWICTCWAVNSAKHAFCHRCGRHKPPRHTPRTKERDVPEVAHLIGRILREGGQR